MMSTVASASKIAKEYADRFDIVDVPTWSEVEEVIRREIVPCTVLMSSIFDSGERLPARSTSGQLWSLASSGSTSHLSSFLVT